jgi:hypothetical protein
VLIVGAILLTPVGAIELMFVGAILLTIVGAIQLTTVARATNPDRADRLQARTDPDAGSPTEMQGLLFRCFEWNVLEKVDDAGLE